MPTYEYRCPSCGHEFEKVQKITSKAKPKCPECGKRAERRISTGVGLVFKGTGFYATDYKRAGEPKEAGEKPEKKPEQSPEKSQPSDTSSQPSRAPGAEP